MGKFSGKIGYASIVETAPGVSTEVITERSAVGDVLKSNRRLENSQRVNDNLTVNNQLSIVADAFSSLNYFSMRYAVWNGAPWKIINVEVQRPRLILTLGEVYNGQRPTS